MNSICHVDNSHWVEFLQRLLKGLVMLLHFLSLLCRAGSRETILEPGGKKKVKDIEQKRWKDILADILEQLPCWGLHAYGLGIT
jgi:hypothetical protein